MVDLVNWCTSIKLYQLQYYSFVLQKLQVKSTADGTRKLVKVIGPNSNSPMLNKVYNYKDLATNSYVFRDKFDNYPKYKAFYNVISSATKWIVNDDTKTHWMDEYGSAPEVYRNTTDYGTYIFLENITVMNGNTLLTLIWA